MAKTKRKKDPSTDQKGPLLNVVLILILFVVILLGYLQNSTAELTTSEAEDHSEEINRIEEYFHQNPLQGDNEKYFLDVSYLLKDLYNFL